MITVSNADRVVFPEVGRTKGDVVTYYERIAPRALPHLLDRPLSIKRFPKGLAGAGFFQKNVPAHYPPSITRFAVPRSREATKLHPRKGQAAAEDVTQYPVIHEAEHLAYLANQGAIEIHAPGRRISSFDVPDRIVIDLDPPEGAIALVRRAALLTRDLLAELGLASVPVATGSKGYHVIAPVAPTAEETGAVDGHGLLITLQKVAALLTHRHPDAMTDAFRIANRGGRVFVDWLRNAPNATVIAPYSLRARPRATVAAPLAWAEIEQVAPDAFSIDDVDALLERADTLQAAPRGDVAAFVAKADAAFEATGLVLEPFDRFRS